MMMNKTRTTRIPLDEQEVEARMKRLQVLADTMDSCFAIPGTNYRMGLDPLLGLIPGVGDMIGSLISSYIIREAHLLGVPLSLKMRMVGNVVMDAVVGSIPLLGDVFDMGFKANRRNLRLLKHHVSRNLRNSQ